MYIYSPFKRLSVNILGVFILIHGAGLGVGHPGRRLHDPVTLPQVSPPHMLVGDLYDVTCREPAFLTVGKADAFIEPWEKEGNGKERKEVGEENKRGKIGGFFLLCSCKKVETNQYVGLRIDAVMRTGVY